MDPLDQNLSKVRLHYKSTFEHVSWFSNMHPWQDIETFPISKAWFSNRDLIGMFLDSRLVHSNDGVSLR